MLEENHRLANMTPNVRVLPRARSGEEYASVNNALLGIVGSASKLCANLFKSTWPELGRGSVIDHVLFLSHLKELAVGLLLPHKVAAM